MSAHQASASNQGDRSGPLFLLLQYLNLSQALKFIQASLVLKVILI